jgi:transcriptional regulator with XRE-family HTH domain
MTNPDRTPREGDRVEVTYATGNGNVTHEGTLVEKFATGERIDIDTEYADDPESLLIKGLKVENGSVDSTSVLGLIRDIQVVEDGDETEEEEPELVTDDVSDTTNETNAEEWLNEIERRRAQVGMSQSELSKRAGFEVARLSTIKSRGHSPTEETRQAFESVLEEAEEQEKPLTTDGGRPSAFSGALDRAPDEHPMQGDEDEDGEILIPDGGEEYAGTLELMDGGDKLLLPEPYASADTGVVIRMRRVTQDWKSGLPYDYTTWDDNDVPDDRARNPDLEPDEVRLKLYGEEPELYRVETEEREVTA